VTYARKFLANYTILVIGDIGAKLMLFWALVRMARVLGSGLFGDIAFAAAFTTYFAVLVSQGLDAYGGREVARNPSLLRYHVGNILGLRAVASVFAALALASTVFLLPKSGNVKVLLLLYGLLFFTTAFSLRWVFQATEQMKFVAASILIAQLVFSLSILALLKDPSQFLYVPILQFIGDLVSILFLLVIYARTYGFPRVSLRFQDWSNMLRDSFPMGLSAALGLTLYNFDMVMLGFLRPASEVGLYSAAFKIVGVFLAFIHLYGVNLIPAVSRCRAEPAVLRRISDKSLKYTLLLAIPLAAGGTLLASPLMSMIYGEEFSGGAAPLRILFWIIPTITSRVVYRTTLLTHGFQQQLLWIVLAAAVTNIGFNFLLIPNFGINGAAVASVVSATLFQALLLKQVARKVTRLPLSPHVWKPLLACIPMAVVVLLMPTTHALVRIPAGFLAYVFAAWAIRAFSPREIRETVSFPTRSSETSEWRQFGG
jgi:O-antigen/teichoic acid export membrane protein